MEKERDGDDKELRTIEQSQAEEKQTIEMTEINERVDAIVRTQPRSLDSPKSSSPESIIRTSSGAIMDRGQWTLDDQEDELLISTRPSKSHVLHYFSKALNFTIRRVDGDIQITDTDGFPLFDAYVDIGCVGRNWTIESYGQPVLFMREYCERNCCRRGSRILVYDWNGHSYGEVLAGETIYVRNKDGKALAKLVPHTSNILSADNASVIEESTSLTGSNPGLETLLPLGKSSFWICVQEEDGKRIAQIENFQNVRFSNQVAFQLKLLSLAAIIRLLGNNGPEANCYGTVKMILNCCVAY